MTGSSGCRTNPLVRTDTLVGRDGAPGRRESVGGRHLADRPREYVERWKHRPTTGASASAPAGSRIEPAGRTASNATFREQGSKHASMPERRRSSGSWGEASAPGVLVGRLGAGGVRPWHGAARAYWACLGAAWLHYSAQ